MLMSKIKTIISNKVFIYLITRYMTYFIQFLVSIMIAVKLGPYYFGIWGFILLLLNYFYVTNFGIANSLNILLVQSKNDQVRTKNYVSTSLCLIFAICFLVILLAIYYKVFGVSLFDKYSIGVFFYFVCIIAILVYINNLLMTIYRVRNSLFEIAFYQSIVPILTLITLFCSKDRTLLYFLIAVYIIGNIISLILFIVRGKIPSGGKFKCIYAKKIVTKGMFLFIYNFCFYLILISTRTAVSSFYSVEEFGYFTFAYLLANSILLLTDALSFIIFPKMIDKLGSTDSAEIEKTILFLRNNYISLVHGLIYLALILFPFLFYFIPKYSLALPALYYITLTILLYSNSFGYNAFLMAQNRERTIAKISFSSLSINIILILCFVYIFHIEYTYVIIATMVSYFVYSILCTLKGEELLTGKSSIIAAFKKCFPKKLLIPYITALVVVISNVHYLIALPFFVYIALNINTIKAIVNTVKRIVLSPSIIDIQ
jgi:Membrane protein involved in the export of O-antigen and teichoic acid